MKYIQRVSFPIFLFLCTVYDFISTSVLLLETTRTLIISIHLLSLCIAMTCRGFFWVFCFAAQRRQTSSYVLVQRGNANGCKWGRKGKQKETTEITKETGIFSSKRPQRAGNAQGKGGTTRPRRRSTREGPEKRRNVAGRSTAHGKRWWRARPTLRPWDDPPAPRWCSSSGSGPASLPLEHRAA